MNNLKNKKGLLFIAAMIVLLGVALFMSYLLNNFIDIDNLNMEYSTLGVVIYSLICFSTPLIVFLPEMPVIVAGVPVFGPKIVFICGVLGVVSGATFMFWLARLGKDKFFKKIIKKEHLDLYNRLVSKNETFYLAVLFLIPVLADAFVCIGAGFSNIKFKKYFIITLLSKCVTVFMYSSSIGFISAFMDLHIIVQIFILITVIALYLFIKKIVEKIKNS